MGNFYQAVSSNKSKLLVPLLDTFTGATVAYSLRKLRTDYLGAAVEVYNGSSFADIGFANNKLDTTALETHCGSNDGFVSKWYSQGTSSNTATQTISSQRPKIYDGTSGYLNALKFTPAGNTNLQLSISFDMSNVSAALVAQANAASSGTIIDAHETSVFREFAFGISNGNVQTSIKFNGQASKSQSIAAFDDLFLATMFADNTPANDSYINGSQMTGSFAPAMTPNTTNNIRIGQRGSGTADFSGFIREFVVYFSDESSNRIGIENNIDAFYSIY